MATIVKTPTVEIRVDGRVLDDDLSALVTSVEVDQVAGLPARCRLTLVGGTMDAAAVSAEAELSDLARSLTDRGAELVVTASGFDVELFRGTVVGVEHNWYPEGHQSVVIRGYDALHQLRQERRTEGFSDVDAITVVEQVVSGHDLSVQRPTALTLGGPTLSSIHQSAETDLAFVRRILAPLGLVPSLRGTTVHLLDDDGIGNTVSVRVGRELHRLSVDRRPRPDDIGVLGWDSGAGRGVSAGNGDALGGWLLNEEMAGRLSDAVNARRGAAAVVAKGTCSGDSEIRPGTPIEVLDNSGANALGARPKQLMVSTARHTIDAIDGYVTEFSTEPVGPPDNPSPPPASFTLGIVADVDDPDGRARVKVELPAFGEVETHWLPLVCPGAGDNVGIVAVPAVGAKVIVLGLLDEPGHNAVVLGGIFADGLLGGDAAPGPPVAGGRSARIAARLPGGGRILIDDDGDGIEIENGAGSSLKLTPSEVLLHAECDLRIAAPGRTLSLQANRIDMERA